MSEIMLQDVDGRVLASSREVAENFSKRHDHVLRDISSLKKDIPNFGEMFEESEQADSYGRLQKVFKMNRDGFSLLAMGFTGKKALMWKLKYIEAFNKMEERLISGVPLSEKEKLELQLFSKNKLEVAQAHNRLVEIEVIEATTPLLETIEEQKPKAEFYDSVDVAENCINFGEFAASFQNTSIKSFGRNKIMEWCREYGYLCSSYTLLNKPSQQMIDSEYMKYKENINQRDGKKYITYTPLLTGKGQIWLTKKLNKYFEKVA